MRTLVRLPISQAAYDEIAAKLMAVNYRHCFLIGGGIALIDIAIERDPHAAMPPNIVEVDPKDISRDHFRAIYQLDNLGTGTDEA